MTYQMKHAERDGVFTIELNGKKTMEAAVAVWSELQAIVEQKKLDRVLVIDAMDDSLTVWDFGDIEAFLTESGFPRNVHVAIVDPARNQRENSNAFGELFLLNRGWHRIKVFESLEPALAWLRSEHAQAGDSSSISPA